MILLIGGRWSESVVGVVMTTDTSSTLYLLSIVKSPTRGSTSSSVGGSRETIDTE